MFVNFSAVNYQAQQELRSVGITVRRTTLGEVSAALLGYATYAAYHDADVGATGVMLEDAQHIVFQSNYAEARCRALGVTSPSASYVVACVAERLKEAIRSTYPDGPSVYSSLEDFEADFLQPRMEEEVAHSNEASSAMAETNAYIDTIEVDEFDHAVDILSVGDTWTATGRGAIYMDQDTEKPFNGDKVKFSVEFFFEKNGRVGLTHVDTEVSAGVDYSWHENEDYV